LLEKSIDEKIFMQTEFIEELEKRGKENIEQKKNKIQELSDLEVSVSGEIDAIQKKVTSLNSQLEEFSDAAIKLKKLTSLKGKIQQKVISVDEEHKFFNENSVCPTCKQSIEEDFRSNKVNEIETNSKDLKEGYIELEKTIEDEERREHQFIQISKEISRLNNEISKDNICILNYRKNIKELQNEIQTIIGQFENRNIETEKLKSLHKEKEDNFKKKSRYKETVNYFDFAQLLMKDGGVKSKIIQKYIPLMNQQINKYLQMMEFYINFTLDDEFKENIKSPIHEDFSYESFSEGEKMRINLAILFTWREIARMKNSVSTNLLILDEVFDSSLDNTGTDYFTKIIKYVIKDTNVFVISHKTDELIDKFDRIITFEKVKGFSKILT